MFGGRWGVGPENAGAHDSVGRLREWEDRVGGILGGCRVESELLSSKISIR